MGTIEPCHKQGLDRFPGWSRYRTESGLTQNEKRPRKAEPSSPFGAGTEIQTHDFNLGNPSGA
jgi:hypothetical protein